VDKNTHDDIERDAIVESKLLKLVFEQMHSCPDGHEILFIEESIEM